MAQYLIEGKTLTDIADAIRSKTGGTDGIEVRNFADEIENIEAGTELPSLTNPATAEDALSGKDFIDNEGNRVVGTIATKTSSNLSANGATVTVPAGYYASQVTKSVDTATRADTTISTTADDTNDKLTITASNNQTTGYVTGANKTATTTISLTANGATVTASDGSKSVSKSVTTATQATPSVSIDTNGLITASATQTAGYVSAGTKSGTKQLTTQAAKTITPTKSTQTAVAKNVYTTGVITVGAIPSEYITTTDATAEAGEIMSGETAYVNGSKITGTFTINDELTTQDNLITQIQTALQNKATPSGTDTSDATAAAGDILSGKTAYVKGTKVTGTMATATQAMPSIAVDSSGLITATAIQEAGYVGAGTKTGMKQLTTQAAKTITPSTSSQTAVAKNVYTTGAVTVAAIPSTYVKPTATKTATTYTPTTSDQTIAAGTYCSGAQTIKGDLNLKAANIADGVTIFGVTGTHSGSENLDTELTTQENLISQLSTILDSKASGGSGGGFESNTDVCNISITSDYRTEAVCYYSSAGHTVNNEYLQNYNISAICGSVVYIVQSGLYSATASAGEILQTLGGEGLTYRVPSTPMNITINIVTD